MSYTLTHAFDGDILVITFHGHATAANARAIVDDYLRIISETSSKKVITDIRNLEGRVSFGSLYFIMRNLPQNQQRVFRNAIVDVEKHREFDEFMETTSANVGVCLQLFFDYEEALKWLREPQDK